MVYFTCNACGEQVKKPQVEKHCNKCRRCEVLTCIDCLKDFYGDEYKTHTQCMSEAQRYSKEGRTGWDPTAGQGNKGEKKQAMWMGKLRELLDSATDIEPAVRNIVDQILDHENIPRKRPKFINFVKNIMRNKASMSNIDKTWDLFSQALQPPAAEAPKMTPAVEEPAKLIPEDSAGKQTKKEKKKKKNKEKEPEPVLSEPVAENKTEKVEKREKKKKKERKAENESLSENVLEEMEVDPQKKKSKKNKKKKRQDLDSPSHDQENTPSPVSNKKRKLDESMEVDQDEPEQPSAKKQKKFDWDATITTLLADKEEMKLNKLKKKCVAEFFAQNDNAHQTPEEVGAKFDKKIKRKQYRILKDRVRLVPRHCEETNGDGEVMVENTNGINGNANGTNKSASAAAVTNGVAAPDQKLSFNKWEAASFGNSAQTEKFRRLMGIKTDKPPEKIDAAKRDDNKIFRDLENGFEKARNNHFKAKGKGLGFS